jgi:hypothetical protein
MKYLILSRRNNLRERGKKILGREGYEKKILESGKLEG